MLRRKSHRRRRGAQTVEFAIAAPVLFFFVMASVEFGRMNMVRHSLDNAVYEGVRRGLVVNSTSANVTSTVTSILTAAAVRNPTVTSTITEDDVTVTATVNMNDNSWMTPVFFKNRTLTSTLKLNRR